MNVVGWCFFDRCLLPQFPVPSIPASLLSVCCYCCALSQLHAHHHLSAEGFPVPEFKISPWVWALLLSLFFSTSLAVPWVSGLAAGSSPLLSPWTAPACDLHPAHFCRARTQYNTSTGPVPAAGRVGSEHPSATLCRWWSRGDDCHILKRTLK